MLISYFFQNEASDEDKREPVCEAPPTTLGRVKRIIGDKAKRTERRRVKDGEDSVHPILEQTRLQVLRSPSPKTCCTEGKIEKVH